MINLPNEHSLKSMDTVINLLKQGCFITDRDDPRDGEKSTLFQNTGPCGEDYQCRNYSKKDFDVLLENGFITLDSGNFDTGERHYYWDFYNQSDYL